MFRNVNFLYLTISNPKSSLRAVILRRVVVIRKIRYYPADTQTCEVILRSNAYPSDELTLLWDNATLEDCGGQNFDFQIRNISRVFKLEGFRGSDLRSYDQITVKILARRKFSYHLVQTFFPSIFFIIITWLGFVLPQDMIEARIAISMTTLLTLTAMFSSIRSDTPNVSYVRAIDIWMVACIFFVFLTLLEFMLLVWIQYIQKKMLRDDENKKEFTDETKERAHKAINKWKRSSSVHMAKLKQQREMAHLFTLIAEVIEKYAFVIFCILFIAFCAVFWGWLLHSSKYFEWNTSDDEFRELNCLKSNTTENYSDVLAILNKTSNVNAVEDADTLSMSNDTMSTSTAI